MKTLFCLVWLVLAMNASAIPVQTLQFAQDNWDVEIEYVVRDGDTGLPQQNASVYINGFLRGHGISAFSYSQLLPMEGPTLASGLGGFVYGVNTFSVVYEGVTYSGPSFTLTEPTGDRITNKTPVPDSGSTAWLFGIVCLLLCAHRQCFRFTPT